MLSPTNSVGESIMLSGSPSAAFIRLERSRYQDISWTAPSLWHLQGIFSSHYWWPIRFWRSKVKVTAGRRGGEGICINTGQHQSPSSYSKNNSLYLHIKAC